jgi:hypothetical protein
VRLSPVGAYVVGIDVGEYDEEVGEYVGIIVPVLLFDGAGVPSPVESFSESV